MHQVVALAAVQCCFLVPALGGLHSRPLERGAEAEVAEAVFQQAFIPRKLDEVAHYERDRDRLAAGDSSEGIYYQVVTGMSHDLSGAGQTPVALQRQQQQQATIPGSASHGSSANHNSATAAAPLPTAAGVLNTRRCGEVSCSQRGDAGSGSGASSSAAPSVAGPDVAAAAAKLKRNAGKGPSFLAFLPKAEDQLPADSSSSSDVLKQAAAARSMVSGTLEMCPGSAAAAAGAGAGATDGSSRGSQSSEADGIDDSRSSAVAADHVVISNTAASGSSCSSDSDSDSEDGSCSSSSSISGSEGRASDDGIGSPAVTNRPSEQEQDKKTARKEHKKAVKEANREKRKTKVPRHVKKQHKSKAKKKK